MTAIGSGKASASIRSKPAAPSAADSSRSVTSRIHGSSPDYPATLNDESRPLRERLAHFGRAVAADEPGDTEELAMYLEFFAALLRAPDALQRYSSGRERRLRQLADADGGDGGEVAAEVTPVQAWVIKQAMLVGLQIEKRLSPRLVTPEVFERAFSLLAGLDQEQ
jgi:hypothetical protein